MIVEKACELFAVDPELLVKPLGTVDTNPIFFPHYFVQSFSLYALHAGVCGGHISDNDYVVEQTSKVYLNWKDTEDLSVAINTAVIMIDNMVDNGHLFEQECGVFGMDARTVLSILYRTFGAELAPLEEAS